MKKQESITGEAVDQYAIVKVKADNMETMLVEFQVNNDEELGIVADKIKEVKTLKKYIEGEKDKFVAPAKAIIAEAKEKYDIYIKKCENAEIVLKQRASKFMTEQEQKRIADEKKLADKVDSGYMKPETAMKKMESLPEVKNTVRTDQGSGLRMAKRKVAKIVDMNLIPDEYWEVNEIRVRRDALECHKNNMPQIPGMEIVEESNLSSI